MVELSYLLEIESEFDLDSIGFSTAEVDVIVSDVSPDDLDDPPPRTPEPNKVISRPGNIFTCGEHRIGVGDYQAAQKGLGLVPEDRRIIQGLTVEENLQLAQIAPPRGWSIERVYELFPRLG